MNRDGLKKPSYYAFELLQKLGEEITVKGDGYVATQNQDGSMQLLLYHYVHLDHMFSSGDWSEMSNLNRYGVFEEKSSKGISSQHSSSFRSLQVHNLSDGPGTWLRF